MTPDTIAIVTVGGLLCVLVIVLIIRTMDSRIDSLERRQTRLEELFWNRGGRS